MRFEPLDPRPVLAFTTTVAALSAALGLPTLGAVMPLTAILAGSRVVF